MPPEYWQEYTDFQEFEQWLKKSVIRKKRILA